MRHFRLIKFATKSKDTETNIIIKNFFDSVTKKLSNLSHPYQTMETSTGSFLFFELPSIDSPTKEVIEEVISDALCVGVEMQVSLWEKLNAIPNEIEVLFSM